MKKKFRDTSVKLIVLYFPVLLVQRPIKGTRFVFLLFKRIFSKKNFCILLGATNLQLTEKRIKLNFAFLRFHI